MSREIPYGHCHCGCGEKTKLAPSDHKGKGHVKGEPLRYIYGHWGRKSPVDYIVDADGCWVWQLRKMHRGYGMTNRQGKAMPAHRAYYESLVGPIPDGLELDHLCRNRACVNPEHLEPVTHAENCRRGANARLTMVQAREIRGAEGSHAAIARQYGVSADTVARIRKGETWSEAA